MYFRGGKKQIMRLMESKTCEMGLCQNMGQVF